MAFSINHIFLVGNVARDPELRYTPNGNPVLTFSVATNHSVKVANGYEDIPTFHRIVCWGRTAEWLANNLVKGMRVAIEGRQENRKYEKDGQTRYTSEVNASSVIPMAKDKFAEEVAGAVGGTDRPSDVEAHTTAADDFVVPEDDTKDDIEVPI
jgi:single-strand DNA-binding protein